MLHTHTFTKYTVSRETGCCKYEFVLHCILIWISRKWNGQEGEGELIKMQKVTRTTKVFRPL
jgi:hypothetical protein